MRDQAVALLVAVPVFRPVVASWPRRARPLGGQGGAIAALARAPQDSTSAALRDRLAAARAGPRAAVVALQRVARGWAGRLRGGGRGGISRVGGRADSRPLLFFSSGAACCRRLAPSCNRIIHDIGIILQFWRCMLKAACVAVDGLKDEVLVSTMLRYITQTMVAP